MYVKSNECDKWLLSYTLKHMGNQIVQVHNSHWKGMDTID